MASSTKTISDKATQARLACKRLIQFIFQSGLKDGDSLPPQEELRGELGFSHDSLSRAMKLLVEHGMITRKPRVGTIIKNRAATIADLWTVALPIFSQGKQNDLFIDTLLRCLQNELTQMGCRWKCYMRQGIPEDEKAKIKDFPGLNEDIKQGAIDGILSPALLHESDVAELQVSGFPVCNISSLENFSCGVGINTAPMIEKAVTTLLAEGCQHLALVSGKSLLGEGQKSVRDTFKAQINGAISSCEKAELLTTQTPAVTRQAGHHIARTILSRPQDERPDGVIILADVLAIGFSEVIMHSEYLPHLVVQTNQQVPVLFGIPATCFEVGVPQMAQTGAQMILERLRNPLSSNEKKWVVPEKKEDFLYKEEDFSITQTSLEVQVFA